MSPTSSSQEVQLKTLGNSKHIVIEEAEKIKIEGRRGRKEAKEGRRGRERGMHLEILDIIALL